MGIHGIQPEARRRDGDVGAALSLPGVDFRRNAGDAVAQRYVLCAEVFVSAGFGTSVARSIRSKRPA